MDGSISLFGILSVGEQVTKKKEGEEEEERRRRRNLASLLLWGTGTNQTEPTVLKKHG